MTLEVDRATVVAPARERALPPPPAEEPDLERMAAIAGAYGCEPVG